MTKSGQLVITAGSKTWSLFVQRKKPAKLVWTQAWRRQNKKLSTESSARRRVRKIVKTTVTRATVGMAAEQVSRAEQRG